MSLVQHSQELLDVNQSLFQFKDYPRARSLCDSALVNRKGIEAVPFLLARSTASRSLNESSKALEDALLANQLDPTNPECGLCLGQAYLLLASLAFSDGKSQCKRNEDMFLLGNLASVEDLTNKALTFSSTKGHRDPSFLPKELFTIIIKSMPTPRLKMKMLRVSRGWKASMESQPSIWQSLKSDVAQETYKDHYGLKFVEFFASRSLNTLTDVVIEVDPTNSEKLFEVLGESSQTLKRLTLHGFFESGCSSLVPAIELAIKCPKLESCKFHVSEMNVDRWKDITVVKFDEYDVLSSPSIIRLETTELTNFDFGRMDFFRCAKHIELNFNSIGSFSRASIDGDENPNVGKKEVALTVEMIAEMMRSCSRTIEHLTIRQDSPHNENPDGMNYETIRLPNLKQLVIPGTFGDKTKRFITVIAPLLKYYPRKVEPFIISKDSICTGFNERKIVRIDRWARCWNVLKSSSVVVC